jgi:hypothetical protein
MWGRADDMLCGKDVIDCVFETRRGWRDGFAEPVKQVNSLNSPAAFHAFKTTATPDTGTNGIALSKALSRRSAHDRAMSEIGKMCQEAVQQKQEAVRTGKLTVDAAQADLALNWQKATTAYTEFATDRGELQ